MPAVGNDTLRRLAAGSPTLEKLYVEISGHIDTTPPFSLGYLSETTQTTYYLGSITEDEVALVERVLEQNSIFPENTRIRKPQNGTDFEVLLASAESPGTPTVLPLPSGTGSVRLIQGDHAAELKQICAELTEAVKYVANERQKQFLKAYIESFQTGSLDAYRQSQRIWVRDKGPRVENIFGFVEPYRDPHGTRAEFEGLVAIADDEETKLLARLVKSSATFIRRLPWATPENDGKGPFEKHLFEPPDFSSIHSESSPTSSAFVANKWAALAYCSSIIFPGINLPNVSFAAPSTSSSRLTPPSTTTSAKKAASKTSSSPTAWPRRAEPNSTPSSTHPRLTPSPNTSSPPTIGGSCSTNSSATARGR